MSAPVTFFAAGVITNVGFTLAPLSAGTSLAIALPIDLGLFLVEGYVCD
jgi:hypothetical protein